MKNFMFTLCIGLILYGLYKIVIKKKNSNVEFVFAVVTFLYGYFADAENNNSSNDMVVDNHTEAIITEEQQTTEYNDYDYINDYDNVEEKTTERTTENEYELISENIIFGNLSSENEEKTYLYVPDVSGTYRFDFYSSDATTDYYVGVYLVDGTELKSAYYSDEGLNVNLESGVEYKIIIIQNSGYMEYKINIGVPNMVYNIEGNVINGSLSYIGQENIYTYIAPITGVYRFNMFGSDMECNYLMRITSSNNSEISSGYLYSYGKTVELVANETYYISVIQDDGLLDYTIEIGVPNELRTIDSWAFSGCITYIDQLDQYLYTAPVTGTYRFDLVSDNVLNNYKFRILETNREEISSTFFSRGGTTVELVAGTTYVLEIEQDEGIENYTVNIGIPNPEMFVEGEVITGAIAYNDQINIYKYTVLESGKYKISSTTDNVENDFKIKIISQINEDILVTYYSRGDKTVYLEAGQVYTIKIIQDIGLLTYNINIIKQ